METDPDRFTSERPPLPQSRWADPVATLRTDTHLGQIVVGMIEILILNSLVTLLVEREIRIEVPRARWGTKMAVWSRDMFEMNMSLVRQDRYIEPRPGELLFLWERWQRGHILLLVYAQ